MVYIIRKDPLVLENSRTEQSAMKTKAPVVPNEVKTLVPEHMSLCAVREWITLPISCNLDDHSFAPKLEKKCGSPAAHTMT